MSTYPLKVLVYGGTGSQASHTVYKLLAKGHIPFVLTRDAKKAENLSRAGAKITVGNTGEVESLIKAGEGMDAIALMTPLFSEVLPKVAAENAITAAKAANVKLIVWNKGGKTPKQPVGNPLLDHHQDTTNLLEASGIPYIILEPSVYLENLLGPWTAPFVVNENTLAYPHPDGMQVQWLASADLGAYVVAALERPELAGSHFEIASPELLDGNELAQQFTLALGREIRYYAMPPTEFGGILNNLFGAGAGDGIAKDYQALYDYPEQQLKYHINTKVALEKLPITPTGTKAWVEMHKNVFTKTN